VCKDLGRGDSTGDRVDNFRNFHKPRKKQEQERRNNSGRGDQKNVRTVHSTSNEQASSSHRQRAIVCKSSTRMGRYVSGSRPKVNRQSLLKLSWPTRQKTRFKNRKLNHGMFRFRMMNWHPDRFRPRRSVKVNGKRKLSQRQPGFRVFRLLRFRTHSCERKVPCKLNQQFRIRFKDSNI